jgi:hypothetical protein
LDQRCDLPVIGEDVLLIVGIAAAQRNLEMVAQLDLGVGEPGIRARVVVGILADRHDEPPEMAPDVTLDSTLGRSLDPAAATTMEAGAGTGPSAGLLLDIDI